MRIAALVLAVGVALAPGARADDVPAPHGGWSFQFRPYGWLPWLQGDAVVEGRSFNVVANPAQILEHTDMVWMSYLQAKNGPLTLFADVIYADVSNSASIFTSKQYSPDIRASLGAALSADYQYWMVEFGGMYEVMQWRSGPAAAGAPDTVLELVGGGRYWYQQLDVSVALAGTLDLFGLTLSRNTALAESGVVQWIDPFIGARLRYYPAPGEELWVRGDVGGFGAGSKFSWQAMAAYSWRLCTEGWLTVDGYLAYRALSVDYQSGDGYDRYVYDVIQQGPVIGVTGRF